MAPKKGSRHTELLDLIFSSGGPLSLVVDDFEERSGQREMSEQILKAYQKNEIALIEAGTGTGKSLAYLVPAVYWALKEKEKTVISTHTIALQEQLIRKDIPFLLNALDLDIKAELVKGMSNYLCLRKLDELRDQPALFSDGQEKELVRLESWADHAVEGSKSEIPFYISPVMWEKAGAEADNCTHMKCPHYKRCFFFKARRKAADAQILVVNHHLLFADLLAKKTKGEDSAILPAYTRLICDEAHHLEEIAFDALSKRIDQLWLAKALGQLYSDLNPQKSRLGHLRQILSQFSGALSLISRIEIDLPAKKREALELSGKAFEACDTFCTQLSNDSLSAEQHFRLNDTLTAHPVWKSQVRPAFQKLEESVNSLAQSLMSLCLDLEGLKDKPLLEKIEGDLAELRSIVQRLEEFAANVEGFLEPEEERLQWIERSGSGDRVHLALIDASLDVSNYLKENLLEPSSTVALCSATLSVGADFDYIKERLGIRFESEQRKVTEKIYDSPFDYQRQALLLVPNDLPDPSDRAFTTEASKRIIQAIQASQGNAFILFTSYDMLRACHAEVSAALSDYLILKQGDGSRQTLIETFKKVDKSVLFGTDSFWEGVDVAGEALRCVVLVKLPFRVPSHPKAQAYSDYLIKNGKDPFNDYSLPHAALKFKQGFGRLIRTKNDKGCVVCLDKRIVTKRYGKTFLNSLPKCRFISDHSDKVFQEMREFYKKRTGEHRSVLEPIPRRNETSL